MGKNIKKSATGTSCHTLRSSRSLSSSTAFFELNMASVLQFLVVSMMMVALGTFAHGAPNEERLGMFRCS